jgi:hypothetical protein
MIDDKQAKLLHHKGRAQSFRARIKRLEAQFYDAFLGAQKRALAHCLMLEHHLDPSNESHALTIKEMEDEIIDICLAADEMIAFFESYDLHA